MTAKKQILSFILVGSINTLFGYSLYAFFIFLGLQYPVALLLSTSIGILFNFKTLGKFVFQNSNNALILKFIGVYTFLYFFNMALIGLLKQASFNLYMAGFIALIPSAMLGFLLNKYFVFYPHRVTDSTGDEV